MATANCPPDRVIERVFTILPSEAQDWAKERHLPQPPVELCELHPDGGERWRQRGETLPGQERAPRLVMGQASMLTSPDQGSTYRVSPQIPLDDQCIEVAARPGDGVQPRTVTLVGRRDGSQRSYPSALS